LPIVTDCRDRATCYGALQVTRALVNLGEAAEARALFNSTSRAMVAMGLGNARRLEVARGEVVARR
jgi:hypothetical protein